MSSLLKFQVPAGMKIGAVCAAEQRRYALTGALAYRRPGDGKLALAATDGKALAIVPLAADGPDKPVLLPADACNANGKPLDVEANGEVRCTSGKTTKVYPLPEQTGAFPRLVELFNGPAAELDNYTAVMIDAKLLARLAGALSSCGLVRLFVPKLKEGESHVDKALAVVGLDEAHAPTGIGLLMPMSAGKRENVAQARDYFKATAREVPTDTVRFDVPPTSPA